jgi:hypothetical protein
MSTPHFWLGAAAMKSWSIMFGAIGQRCEQVLVQALVAQATIERFHKAILLRLARGDVAPVFSSSWS